MCRPFDMDRWHFLGSEQFELEREVEKDRETLK
jgi:hypothetical protein